MRESPREMEQIVREIAVYPPEAYEFVQRGLQYTVERLKPRADTGEDVAPRGRHITGQELSWGLRLFAWERWGLMARTVLRRWNITSTMDFGKVVYALIEGGVLARSPSDRLEDFRSVYDFSTLEREYRIERPTAIEQPTTIERPTADGETGMA